MIPENRHRILVAAGFPDENSVEPFPTSSNQITWIPEAMICLTRAVLSNRGELVMGMHRLFGTLLPQVASEYRIAPPVEGKRFDSAGDFYSEETFKPRVVLYQSMKFPDLFPDELQLFQQLGLARVVFTNDLPTRPSKRKNKRRHDAESLRELWEYMILHSSPCGMICVGGTEELADQAELFSKLRPNAPIFAFKSLGGSLLADIQKLRGKISLFDVDVLEKLERLRVDFPVKWYVESEFKAEVDFKSQVSDAIPVPAIPPYPLLMQLIVEELIRQ